MEMASNMDLSAYFRNAYPNVLEMLDDSYSLLVRALEYHFRPRTMRRPLAAAAANSQFRALPWSTDAEMAELYVAVATKDNVAVKVSLAEDPFFMYDVHKNFGF